MPPLPHRGDSPRPAARPATRGRNLTAAEERAHLVRVIASSPVYVDWLRDHDAALLRDEALRAQEHGHPEVALHLAERAEARLAGRAAA